MSRGLGVALAILLGLALLSYAWLCWTGRVRGWAEERHITGQIPRGLNIALLPGVGLGFLGGGVGYALFIIWPSSPVAALIGALIGLLAVLAFFPTSIVLAYWDPDWYGPRWYREVKRAFAEPVDDLSWMAEDAPLRSASTEEIESDYEATERHLRSGRPDPRYQRARLRADPSGPLGGDRGAGGKVFYYPRALVFSVGDDERGQPVIIAAESILGVQEVSRETVANETGLDSSWPWAPVRVDIAAGGWLFEALRPEHMAREVQRRYINEATKPYGVKRPRRPVIPQTGQTVQ